MGCRNWCAGACPERSRRACPDLRPEAESLYEVGPAEGATALRLLGLDLGERRIGLAVSDADGMMALPVGHLDRTKLHHDIDRILDLARQREVEGIVVGVPYTLSGEISPQGRWVQGFIRALKKRTTLCIYTVDERFTSVEAEGLLRDAGRQPSRERGTVDAAAAALILQRFLDQSGA